MVKSLRLRLLLKFLHHPKQFAREWTDLAAAREALERTELRLRSVERSLADSRHAIAAKQRGVNDEQELGRGDSHRAGVHPSDNLTYDRARDLKAIYEEQTWRLMGEHEEQEAMSLAVGGDFDNTGRTELAILQGLGLQSDHRLIDVGCGSGRLAKPLASFLSGPYSGFDLVADLVEYARKISGRPDWRFAVVDRIDIPEPDGCADMVCFFSVLTHLMHEQSYWYLEEAVRVLKPGGAIVLSFLDFDEPSHWPVFLNAVNNFKQSNSTPLDVFISKQMIRTWSAHLSLEVERFIGSEESVGEGRALGQSICLLRKPRALLNAA
jgi:ubiquinone/menaquinone biosynthesis C-methylase UbiE